MLKTRILIHNNLELCGKVSRQFYLCFFTTEVRNPASAIGES